MMFDRGQALRLQSAHDLLLSLYKDSQMTMHLSAYFGFAVRLGLIWAACALSPLGAQPKSGPMPGDYQIEAGRVDPGTYAGWRIFHTTCHACHGVGAVGTDVAPNLLERIGSYTPRAFATKVLTSYRIVVPQNGASSDDAEALRDAMLDNIMRRERGPSSQVIMPAWGDHPQVSPHVLDLFAYLSARADGKIGPGEPRKAKR